MFHVDIDDAGIQVSAVLLPLDRFFEMRASAAIRLWHGLTGAILVPAAWSRTSKTGGDYLFLEALRSEPAGHGLVQSLPEGEWSRRSLGAVIQSPPARAGAFSSQASRQGSAVARAARPELPRRHPGSIRSHRDSRFVSDTSLGRHACCVTGLSGFAPSRPQKRRGRLGQSGFDPSACFFPAAAAA